LPILEICSHTHPFVVAHAHYDQDVAHCHLEQGDKVRIAIVLLKQIGCLFCPEIQILLHDAVHTVFFLKHAGALTGALTPPSGLIFSPGAYSISEGEWLLGGGVQGPIPQLSYTLIAQEPKKNAWALSV
jgi:hypothetical protein